MPRCSAPCFLLVWLPTKDGLPLTFRVAGCNLVVTFQVAWCKPRHHHARQVYADIDARGLGRQMGFQELALNLPHCTFHKEFHSGASRSSRKSRIGSRSLDGRQCWALRVTFCRCSLRLALRSPLFQTLKTISCQHTSTNVKYPEQHRTYHAGLILMPNTNQPLQQATHTNKY